MHFRKIYVEISNLCNLKCSFCPGTHRPGRRMTPEEFAKIVRECVDMGATLVGGCCGTTPDHIRAIAK